MVESEEINLKFYDQRFPKTLKNPNCSALSVGSFFTDCVLYTNFHIQALWARSCLLDLFNMKKAHMKNYSCICVNLKGRLGLEKNSSAACVQSSCEAYSDTRPNRSNINFRDHLGKSNFKCRGMTNNIISSKKYIPPVGDISPFRSIENR